MILPIFRLLVQLVDLHGTKKWSQIAKMLQGRVGKQCRERWHNHLRPDIKVSYFILFSFSYFHRRNKNKISSSILSNSLHDTL